MEEDRIIIVGRYGRIDKAELREKLFGGSKRRFLAEVAAYRKFDDEFNRLYQQFHFSKSLPKELVDRFCEHIGFKLDTRIRFNV